MDWYYSQQGQQRGPVSTEQLTGLARSGVVTGQTLVWREGLANWTPYSVAAPNGEASLTAASAAGVAGRDLVVCAECGLGFSKSDTVQIEGSCVCAGCKPIFMQKLREGITVGSPSGIWRSGRQLVTSVNATLPRRCLKCNAPADGKPIKRKLYWHPPLVYLAFFLGILVYVVIALVIRKNGLAFVSICHSHRSARRIVILVSWLLVIGGLVAGIAGIANDSGWLGGIGGAAFLGGLIFGIVRGRLVVAQRITKDHMWLGGCGDEFVAGFPEWHGPA
jgi:GYF domain 2